jgi:hypothetical protein
MIMKKIVLIAISCFLVLVVAVLFLFRGAIFQRGNPLPYVSKMFTMNDNNPYEKVFDDGSVYITRSADNNDLVRHIENAYEVTFSEQMGSAYFFGSDEKSIIAETEIYWRKYQVWEITIHNNLFAWKSYALENATERQRMERMTQFSLYTNGTASFAVPQISSYIPPNCTYTVESDEMVFRAIIKTEHEKGFFGLEDSDIVARFLIEDENTLVFLSAEVALFAEQNGRYVLVYPDDTP